MSYVGRGLEVGSMRQLDDISSSFDGSTTAFTMQINSVNVDQSVVGDVNQLVLSVGGVIQKPGTDFTVSGSTLTFTTAPAANLSFFCIVYGGGGGFATPGDLTVTTSKLATTVLTGATDIGAAIVDADLFLIDDGAGGTLRKTAASRLKTYIGGSDPASADGDSLGTASLEWSDLYLADGGIIYFGNDQDVTLTHNADKGLILKHKATADDKPVSLTLQTGETDIAADDVIGKIEFQAPDEGTGTDAILVAAGIQAVSEGDFSSSSNATKLSFLTGASEAAAEKMSIASSGATTITVADNSDTLTLVSTDADANSGPNLNMYRNSASPADNDHGGEIAFNAKNDAGEIIKYGKIRLQTDDVSDGAETGRFDISTMFAGSEISRFMIKSDEIVVNQNGVDFDFRVESDNNAHCLFVKADDSRVGINNSNPAEGALGVEESVANYQMIYAEHTAASGNIYGIHAQFTAQDPDNNTSRFFAGGNDTFGNRYLVYADGDVVNHDNSYGSTSDSRIKSNIVDANSQWDDIKALKVRNYKKNDDITKYGDKAWVQIGVIAQELEAAGMDKLVKNETKYEAGDLEVVKGKKNVDDIKEYKSVKYSVLYMKAIKALQEAMAKIEALETSNTDLKNRVTALEG